jgi:hypothetical protein
MCAAVNLQNLKKIFPSSKRLIRINGIVDIDGHFPHLRIACHHEERWKMKSEDFTFTQLVHFNASHNAEAN